MEKFVFDPTAFGPAFSPLLNAEFLNALGPGSPVVEMRARLETLDLDRAFPQRIRGTLA